MAKLGPESTAIFASGKNFSHICDGNLKFLFSMPLEQITKFSNLVTVLIFLKNCSKYLTGIAIIPVFIFFTLSKLSIAIIFFGKLILPNFA